MTKSRASAKRSRLVRPKDFPRDVDDSKPTSKHAPKNGSNSDLALRNWGDSVAAVERLQTQ